MDLEEIRISIERGLNKLRLTQELQITTHELKVKEELLEEANAEINKQKRFSENIVATVPDSLLVLDKDLRIKSANRSFYESFQTEIEPKKVIGSSIADILQDEDGKLSTELTKLFGTKDMLENFELHYRSEKLGERIFDIRARGILIEEEEEEEELVVIEDITERKRAEEKLEATNRELETTNWQIDELMARTNQIALEAEVAKIELNQIFNAAADGMCDKAFNVLRVNETFSTLFGISNDKAVGKKCFEVSLNPLCHTPNCPLKQILDGEERVECEVEKERNDGTGIPCILTATPFWALGDELTGIIEDYKDVSERKRAEEKIKISLKKLKESEEKLHLIGRLTRHDVSNWLFVIKAFAQKARETKKNTVIQDYLEKIEESIEVAENVLTFSEEYQKLGVEEPEWRDMRKSCENGISDINLNSILLRDDLEGLEIYTDYLIENVFSNLADNTIRHGGAVSEIKVNYKEFENGLKLVYEDDGVGVPGAKKEKIFERGYGDNAGYGLDLIKRILGISGMEIKETGEPGKGARFEIIVPKDRYRILKSF